MMIPEPLEEFGTVPTNRGNIITAKVKNVKLRLQYVLYHTVIYRDKKILAGHVKDPEPDQE
jgi:hypothetical protein